MVREVQRRGAIGLRVVLDVQLVVVGERERDGDGDLAGKALVAVGAHEVEEDTGVTGALERLRSPQLRVKPVRTAVQRVRTLVRLEPPGRAVELEGGAADPVRDATNRGAEERVAGDVTFELVVVQRELIGTALTIRRAKTDDRRAVLHAPQLVTVVVRDRVDGHVLAVGHRAECRSVDLHPPRPYSALERLMYSSLLSRWRTYCARLKVHFSLALL